MHSPPPVEYDSMACSFEVQQADSLWTFQEQLEKQLTQDVPFNYAGLTNQPQTHHRVGGITSCFIVLLES